MVEPASPDALVLMPREPTREHYELVLGRPLRNMDRQHFPLWADVYRDLVRLLAAAPVPAQEGERLPTWEQLPEEIRREATQVIQRGIDAAFATEKARADRLEEALREVCDLFDARCYLSCSGERQIEVVTRARAALKITSEGNDGS